MNRQHQRRGPLLLLIAALVAACDGGTSTSHPTTAPGSSIAVATSPAPTTSIASSDSSEPTTSNAPSTSTEPTVQPQDFSERGPFAVGVMTLAIDEARPVSVFYPVDRDAVPPDALSFSYTAADMWANASDVWPLGWALSVPDAWIDAPVSTSGPFPLVVFSHGWGNTRLSSSLHTAHLASWGSVVAAPEHVSRDITAYLAGQETLPPSDLATITDTITLLGSEGPSGDDRLSGAIDIGRIAVEGYSAGGRDATLAASLAEVDTWISAAGTPPVPDDAVAAGHVFVPQAGFDLDTYLAGVAAPPKPSMLLVAAQDVVVAPSYSRSVFAWLTAPTRLAVLADTGHVVFMDGCRQYQQDLLPGLVAVYGLDPSSESVQLGDNGCRPGHASAAEVAAGWNHLATAHLRWVFGPDADIAEASLERTHLDATFPGLLEDYVFVDGSDSSG